MEGPVLTESEVWKVASGTNASLNTGETIDFSPLESPTKESDISVQEETCNIEEQEVTSDQIESVVPHEMRLQKDLPSTQTKAEIDETPEPACKQERCVGRAEEPADKSCLKSDLNQEITILVTNHDCGLEEDADEDLEEKTTCPAEPKSVPSTDCQKAIEEESQDGSIVVANVIEISQVQKASVTGNISTEQSTNAEEPKSPGDDRGKDEKDSDSNPTQKTDTSTTCEVSVDVCGPKDQTRPENEEINLKLKKTQSTERRDTCRPPKETLALRSPGRTQHVQTQVSLEVMYQSVATSPMTPPEGSGAFLFPSSFGKLGSQCNTDTAQSTDTKDAELQVGHEVEFRSVATAPMTPIVLTAPEVIPEPEPRIGTTEEQPEPVQEVSWDEKGMTWEVYGAVVEVAVLGTAIQKHLEKKQKKLSTLTVSTDDAQTDMTETSVPVPSSPSPTSEPSEANPTTEQSLKIEEKEEKVGRRRQNPFRRWLRNIRRPSCCSRPHEDEDK